MLTIDPERIPIGIETSQGPKSFHPCSVDPDFIRNAYMGVDKP
jgi:hypothetical protein